ncbi:MAG: glycosyltransferase family 39 protein [Thaumarchaeota archaeon]|nr:glycosyltransferase family 39 protein [Nitrososphaerota archaeon]
MSYSTASSLGYAGIRLALLSGLLAGVMCFLPGPFLLDYLAKLGRVRVSKTEMVVLGSLVWNFAWVSAAYLVAILTSSIAVFYLFSLGIGAATILLDLYETLRRKPHFRLPSIDLDSTLALALIAVLGAVIAIEIAAHSIYEEFDAIFYYLPVAKSIVLTGGLHFDPLHATGLTTTLSPALPLMYGSVLFFSGSLMEFGLAVRIIPLAYVILTSLGVYLLSFGILEDSKLALVSTVCFLSLPVLMSMSLDYSLYLDMGFVFAATVSMYLVVRVGRYKWSDSFGWLALGVSLGLLLLTKDTAFFIVPSLFILAIMPRLRSLERNLAALLGALVFTGIYTFFFVVDILFFSELGIVAAQTTILGTLVLAFITLRRVGFDNLIAPRRRQILLLIVPSAPTIVFIIRNIVQYRVVSFDLIWFNAVAARASNLIAHSSVQAPLFVVPTFQNLFVIFSSYDAGFIFLLPMVLGILCLLFVHEIRSETKSVYLLFWLMLIGAWGWLFNFAYVGPNLRPLYDFAPIIALLASAGVGFVSRTWRVQNSMVIRLVFFASLALLYLWAGPLNIGSGGVELLSYNFSSIAVPTLQSLSILSILFLIAFVPIRYFNLVRSQDSRRVGRIMVTGAILLILVFPAYSFGSANLGNTQAATTVPQGWENNLSQVISYINLNLKDNYSIMTFYALPIAYFTNHPIIEMTRWFGVTSVLGLVGANASIAIDALVKDGIRYLLIPKPVNSQYQYYLSLAQNFTFLSPQGLSTDLRLVLLSDFTDYQLYRVLG